MKSIPRENPQIPYSLHDSTIVEIIKTNDILSLEFAHADNLDVTYFNANLGHVEFRGIDWDFSTIYLLDFGSELPGNAGPFKGSKMYLHDFVQKIRLNTIRFDVVDETFGYNSTKLSGFCRIDECEYEFILDIYHCNHMVYRLHEITHVD